MMRLPRKAGWLLLALCVAALPSTQSGVADADDGLLVRPSAPVPTYMRTTCPAPTGSVPYG